MELKKQQRTIFLLGIGLLVLILANSMVWFFRLDLTSTGAYGISATSRAMIAELKAPLQLSYYLSPSLKAKHAGFQHIEDILTEFSLASGGKVRLDVIDPGTMTGRMESLGLQPVNLEVVENTKVSQALVYSGLVIKQLDTVRVLPFISSPELLEYDLAVQISQLGTADKVVLGILSGAQDQEVTSSWQTISQQLGQLAEVRVLERGQEIPLEVDVVFGFKLESLKKEELLPLERHVLAGKGLLLGLDPYTMNLQYGIMALGPNTDNALYRMLATWGVKVKGAMVMSPEPYNVPFPLQRQQGNIRYSQQVSYPLWPALAAEDVNRTHALTAGLQGIDLFWASPLETDEGVESEVLFTTIDQAVLAEGQVDADPAQASLVYEMSRGEAKTWTMGLARTGRLSSAFAPDFPDAALPSATEKARVIIMGDSDFASDLIQYTGSSHNIAFLQNALTWLGADPRLMDIKSRSSAAPGLTGIRSIEGRMAVENISILLNAVLVPGALIAYGIVRNIRRRKPRNNGAAS